MKDHDVFCQYERQSLPKNIKVDLNQWEREAPNISPENHFGKMENPFVPSIAVFVLPDPENAILHRMVMPHRNIE